MKKSILSIFLAALACVAQAANVSRAQARQAAGEWIVQNAAFLPNGTNGLSVVAAARVDDTNGVPLWYRANLSDGTCLVLSPVTELEPVIAVLENVPAGGLPSAHPMRTMLETDMRDRLRKLGLYVAPPGGASLMGAAPAAAPSSPAMAAWAEQGRAKWEKLGIGGTRLLEDKKKGVENIATLVRVVDGFEQGGRFTHWDQSTDDQGNNCYNYYTPHNVVCGCVATAMSAIMQFFAVAGCDEGVSCPRGLIRETQDRVIGATYNDVVGNYRTLGGDYDWSIFDENTDRASYSSLTDEQRELLGRVAYDAGVAVAMQWSNGPSGSGAYTPDVAVAFREVFGFMDARSVSDPDEALYPKLIYNQCRAGAPVALSISGEGGHAVVAAGYGFDASGNPRVRIFTGWGGTGDGWYALPYINTKSLPSQSGSYLFDVVNAVITMIGYDSDATVPIIGQVIPAGSDVEVTFPGVTVQVPTYDDEGEPVVDDEGIPVTEEGPLVTKTVGAGYFGVRVSPTLADQQIEVQSSGKTAYVSFGADAADATDGETLADALPGEVFIVLLENTTYAFDFNTAIALALAENKAILRVCVGGNSAKINERVLELDQTEDFPQKFVYELVDYLTGEERDGNPSFAVFMPQGASLEDHWTFYNSRLSYGYGSAYDLYLTVTNDYEVADDEAQYVVSNYQYVVSYSTAMGENVVTNFPYDDEGLIAAFELVMEEGYAAYRRNMDNITLAVSMDPFEAGTSDPPCGVYTNACTNGEVVVASAAGALTNEAAGVVMGCTGWTLSRSNTVTGVVSEPEENEGSTATFTVSSNEFVSLVWNVTTNYVYISVEDQDDGMFGVTSPGSGWYPFGEEVTFVATPAAGCSFTAWAGSRNRPYPEDLEELRDSPVLSFAAEKPLDLYAYYGMSPMAGLDTTNTLRIVSMSVDDDGALDDLEDPSVPGFRVAGLPNGEVKTGAMGDSVDLPAITLGVSLVGKTFTDAGGTSWRCVGWIVSDPGSEPDEIAEYYDSNTVILTMEGPATLIWLWEEYEPDQEDERRDLTDADVPVGPDGSSAITITSNADGTLAVTAIVNNAVKGYWYAIVTDTSLDGTFSTVCACSDVATADGALASFSYICNPSDTTRFFKVRILEDDPGM